MKQLKKLTDKQALWGVEFYNKIKDLISAGITEEDSTPRATVLALGRCFVRTVIGIIGYKRANDVIVKVINQCMEEMREKQKKDKQ